jgi:hypothetical protein
VDPDVAETGQPYAFTGNDPVNETDPLGNIATNQFGQGCGGTISDCGNESTAQQEGGTGQGGVSPVGPEPPTGSATLANQTEDLAHQPSGVDSSENSAAQSYQSVVSPGSGYFVQTLLVQDGREDGVIAFPSSNNSGYLVLGFGGCLFVCFNVETDGLSLSFSGGGTGYIEKGPYIGVSSVPLCDRGTTSVTGGVGLGVGATATEDLGPNRSNEVDVGQITGVQVSLQRSATLFCWFEVVMKFFELALGLAFLAAVPWVYQKRPLQFVTKNRDVSENYRKIASLGQALGVSACGLVLVVRSLQLIFH